MFCENCGAQLDEGARFCDKCGAPVVPDTPALREQAPGLAGKIYYPDPTRYTTFMGLKERSAMLAADDADDFPENE